MIESLQDRRVTPAPPPSLTAKQARILSEITRYSEATGEQCRVSYLERRLNLSRAGVQAHINALWRKGWLESKESPLRLTRPS